MSFDPNPRPLCGDPQLGTRDGWDWCPGCGGLKEPGHVHGLESSPTWPYVLAFAKRMEAKLDLNRHKGDREGWIDDSARALLKRLREETKELARALDGAESRRERAPDEAADVANFAMMIADVCGGVKPG